MLKLILRVNFEVVALRLVHVAWLLSFIHSFIHALIHNGGDTYISLEENLLACRQSILLGPKAM